MTADKNPGCVDLHNITTKETDTGSDATSGVAGRVAGSKREKKRENNAPPLMVRTHIFVELFCKRGS